MYFRKDIKDFSRWLVTEDEIRIYYHTSETTEQSEQWIEALHSVPKKVRSISIAGKVQRQYFGGSKGIETHYLVKDQILP